MPSTQTHPPPDAISILAELSLDEFPGYFSEKNGRLFHPGRSPDPLPVEIPEQRLTNTLSDILYELSGAHYIGPVAELLASQPESKPCQMVLDVGTETRTCITELAQRFSRVHFRGFEIVPIDTRYPPRNVQFGLTDDNTPGPFQLDGTFDVVNARFVDMTVFNYKEFVREAGRLLCSGGLFTSYDWLRLAVFEKSAALNPGAKAPASTQFFDKINEALAKRSVCHFARDVSDILTGTGLFECIEPKEVHIPIGSWPADSKTKDIGVKCLLAQREYAGSIRQLLLDSGLKDADIQTLVANYLKELNDVEGLVSVLCTVHGRRL